MAADLSLIITARDHASSVLKDVNTHAGGLGHTAGTVLKAGMLAGAAGIGVAAFAGLKFVQQAVEEEAGIRRLAAAVDASGGSWAKQGPLIEKVIQDRQRLAFSDDELRSSLSLLTAITGDSDEALRRQAVAMDFARGANIDLGTASKLLGKVTDETVNVLGRYGIRVKEGADATDVLALVQQKFSGQSQAFADSAAGKWAQFKIQMDNLAETIGAALLPVVTSLGGLLASFAEKAIPKVEQLVKTVSLLVKAFIAAASGEGVTSTGIFGFFESLGVIVHDRIIPAVKDFAAFFKGQILPAVKEFVSQKGNLAVLGSVVVALFTAWAITAGIAAASTIAAAAPVLILAGVLALLAAGFVLLEQKTGFFSAALPVVTQLLHDLYDIVGPILFDALVTLKQGWVDLQPALETIAGFLQANVLPALKAVGQFLLDHPALLIALAAAIALLISPWLLVIATIVIVLAKWDEIKAMFTQTIPAAIDSVIKKIQELPIIGAIFTDTWNTVWAIVQLYIGLVLVQVQFLFDSIRNFFAFFKAVFTGDWSGAWNAIKAQGEAIWNALAGSFGLALDAFRSVAASKLEMLKSLGGQIATAIADGFKAAWNAIAIGINHAIPDSIGFDIPKIDLGPLGSIGGGSVNLNLPDNPIPLLAQGGVVMRPTLAMLGERGPEAVIPLNQGGLQPVNVYIQPMFMDATPAQAQWLGEMIANVMRREYRALA